MEAYERGEDPIAFDPPMHPSFEDRAGRARPRVRAVSPELGDHLVDAWARFVAGMQPEVLHLHHVDRRSRRRSAAAAPDVPLVTHLHGTDLKMIDRHRRPRGGRAGPTRGRTGPSACARRAAGPATASS